MPSVHTYQAFIEISADQYLVRARQHLFSLTEDQLDVFEQNILKLHISLCQEDYPTHQNQLAKILLAYTSKGELNGFKYIDSEKLTQMLQKSQALMDKYIQFKALSSSERQNLSWQWWRELEVLVGEKKFYFEHKLTDGIQELIQAEQNFQKSALRFLKGDQFTVYLPENINKEKILEICQTIHNYLFRHNLKGGEVARVSSVFSSHLSLRQEYLHDDFLAIKSGKLHGTLRASKRINAVNSIETHSELESEVKREQETNPLYQYLLGHLEHTPSSIKPSNMGMFRLAQPREVNVTETTALVEKPAENTFKCCVIL